jgi:Glycosyl hydrolase 36 superfamily, catalytic domain
MLCFRRTRLAAALTALAIGGSGCGTTQTDPPDEIPVALTCADLDEPVRPDTVACEDVDAANPSSLVECLRGSGYAGVWTVDADGLPAYDFTAEQRCDSAAQHWSPRSTVQRDPIHLIGNGRGLVAMAHASGGIEIYTQDRGHKWINRVDTWSDPQTPDYPLQLGGGFSYLVDGARTLSTRFEDLPLGRATQAQTRRFGVGYVETVTEFGDLRVRRRTFAPDADARALVAEVEIENLSTTDRELGLVELWDVNIHQVPVELATSDLLAPGISEGIDRKRRALMAQFEHEIAYDAETGVATVETRALNLPEGVTGRDDIADVDYFPDPIYLAALDADASVEAAWLDDREIWGESAERPVPSDLGSSGNAESRTLILGGAGQHPVLAMRVPLVVSAHGKEVRRFAFGYVPGGSAPDADVSSLRASASELASATADTWRERLVWAAFPGLQDAGAMQREIAWASYNALANVTFDEYRSHRVLGQGGAYKYIHGLDGAFGDLALFAESMLLVDPEVAKETLQYCFGSQHASSDPTPWRYPYASTGVGNFSDVGIYSDRSDPYFAVPWITAEYVAVTRDRDFLDSNVAYWPSSAGESGTVLNHLARTMDYATDSLGTGARGFVAMGTGDYADGVLNLTEEETTPHGTSSTYNAGMVVVGFPLAAALVEPDDAALAAEMSSLYDSQVAAFGTDGWGGDWFLRGFADNGNPLAPDYLFLEPQVLPTLGGIVDDARRGQLLQVIQDRLETDIGAVSTVELVASGGSVGGIDQPQVGGIWPVANAWLTEMYARSDARAGWSSFIRNSLTAHAKAYPELWYGIWTGPDSYNGPDHERPGEADAHAVTALTDYPALNTHVHSSPLRALQSLLGVSGTPSGVRIDPRVPAETFSVIWPRLTVRSQPDAISGTITASATELIELGVTVPSGLRQGELLVTAASMTVPYRREADAVWFALSARRDAPVSWSITGAP